MSPHSHDPVSNIPSVVQLYLWSCSVGSSSIGGSGSDGSVGSSSKGGSVSEV